jgi:hypothetical protein
MDKYKELEETILRAEKEITEAKERLRQLKTQDKQKETWSPHADGYYISDWGGINKSNIISRNPHNCFRTSTLALTRQKQREAEDELFNIWEHLVGDWRPDWKNEDQKKYFTSQSQSIVVDGYCLEVFLPTYRYFPTKELARKQYEMASEHAKAYIRGEF